MAEVVAEADDVRRFFEPSFDGGCRRHRFSPSCKHAGQFGMGTSQPGALAFLAHVETFSVNEFDLGDADETEEIAHEIGLRIEGGAGIAAAAGSEDIGFLAGEQALRPVRGIAEGHAGAGDVIDPGFQRRGDAQVVHGQADDQYVGGLQFADQRVGIGNLGSLCGAALFRLAQESLETGAVEVRYGVDGQVADADHRARMAELPCRDKGIGQLAGLALVGKEAGLELQQFGHDVRSLA
ncbi:hypothetical protein SDC9_160745 [bioreactor metagenome]|uniref:Uncharacterized protein n=1 Tax=bioreactor metagenome TaxID=1076179 RepID=A0A645FLZ0_9ZZZZ